MKKFLHYSAILMAKLTYEYFKGKHTDPVFNEKINWSKRPLNLIKSDSLTLLCGRTKCISLYSCPCGILYSKSKLNPG